MSLTPPGVLAGFLPHSETSNGVTVRVGVTYLADQSDPGRGRWLWSYHIRIENGRDQAVRLMTRHWTITDGRGHGVTVEGEGVVGEQPLIMPGGVHDYVSGCPLATATGHMQGWYGMLDEDGAEFEVLIPRFELIISDEGQ